MVVLFQQVAQGINKINYKRRNLLDSVLVVKIEIFAVLLLLGPWDYPSPRGDNFPDIFRLIERSSVPDESNAGETQKLMPDMKCEKNW